MSGARLRQRPRVCYYEPEEPPFDEFVFCSECRDYVYEYCSIHGPLLVIPDDKPAAGGGPAGVPRAALTVPHVFLHLARSDIEGAGIGVFSTLTLPAGVRFGPYRGTRAAHAGDSTFAWQIYDKNNKPSHLIDARDADRSNWMRYVNCSRHWAEQNLVAFQYQGQLYYRTTKIIPRFTELLVFYGSQFASLLGIDLRRYSAPCRCDRCEALNSKKVAPRNKRQVGAGDKPRQEEIVQPNAVTKLQETSTNIQVDLQTNTPATVSARTVVTKQPEAVQQTKPKKRPAELQHKPKNKKIAKYSPLVKIQEPPVKSTDTSVPVVAVKSTIVTDVPLYKCDKCGKTFVVKPELEKHILTHTVLENVTAVTNNGTKRHKCHCGYSSDRKSQLIRHMRVHTGEKPYKCGYCNYTCSLKCNLLVHERKHTGEKPYKCGCCSYSCSDRSSLVSHQRTHTSEKQYKCTHCSYACSDKSSLVSHQRIHTGEKPFNCDICDYRAAHSNSVKYHLISVHAGVNKPHSCTACSYRCVTKSQLKRHVMRKHNLQS